MDEELKQYLQVTEDRTATQIEQLGEKISAQIEAISKGRK